MGRIINVNWADLHKVGEEFLKQANDMNELEKDLTDTFAAINNGWKGFDAEVYKRRGNVLINDIKREKQYLATWHQFLTKSANKYVDNVQNGVLSINRIEKDFEERK